MAEIDARVRVDSGLTTTRASFVEQAAQNGELYGLCRTDRMGDQSVLRDKYQALLFEVDSFDHLFELVG